MPGGNVLLVEIQDLSRLVEGDTRSPDQPPTSSRTISSTGLAWPCLCQDKPWKIPFHPVLWGTCPRISHAPTGPTGATALITSVWLCAPASEAAAACHGRARWMCPDFHPVPGLGRAQRRPQSQDYQAPSLIYPCGRLPTAATCVSRSDLC